MKKLCFFGGSVFKKYCWHLEFLVNLIFGPSFIIFERVRCSSQLLLKLRTSKLLLHFMEYRLDQLNSKHTKTVVNSTTQYFVDSSRKKCLLKVRCFLVHPPHDDPVKFLQNWTVAIFQWPTFSNFTNIRHLI